MFLRTTSSTAATPRSTGHVTIAGIKGTTKHSCNNSSVLVLYDHDTIVIKLIAEAAVHSWDRSYSH